jgi:chromosome segregation ATPase
MVTRLFVFICIHPFPFFILYILIGYNSFKLHRIHFISDCQKVQTEKDGLCYNKINIFKGRKEIMEEMLKQILTELQNVKSEMSSMKSEMNSMKSEINSMKSEINSMKSEMNERFNYVDQQFAEMNYKLEVVREQTASNSELHSQVNDMEKRVDELTMDVKLIKRAITNQ